MLNPRLMKPAQNYQVGFEVTVRAPRERVWSALVDETSNWWPKDFFSAEHPEGFVIEPHLGGRVYEAWHGGGGVLWGTVVVWSPGYRMTWACEMYPDWTGPGRSFVTFDLEEQGAETLMKVSDAGICISAAQAATSLGNGWQKLIGTHFKSYVEAAIWAGPPAFDSGRLNVHFEMKPAANGNGHGSGRVLPPRSR
ncbi:MAG: SRPBCC domain-containing protein [Gemmataceae bacterium]|nr:SRPBCC domain-containing protein [Planctomycetia bacterium]MBX3400180.1 SRPBCC domain-containing protein [Gemmataceae bacterium]